MLTCSLYYEKGDNRLWRNLFEYAYGETAEKAVGHYWGQTSENNRYQSYEDYWLIATAVGEPLASQRWGCGGRRRSRKWDGTIWECNEHHPTENTVRLEWALSIHLKHLVCEMDLVNSSHPLLRQPQSLDPLHAILFPCLHTYLHDTHTEFHPIP